LKSDFENGCEVREDVLLVIRTGRRFAGPMRIKKLLPVTASGIGRFRTKRLRMDFPPRSAIAGTGPVLGTHDTNKTKDF
jgi:hypothetical protein